MDRHVDSALAVAEFLAGHPGVEWVRYPGLADSSDRELARRYLPRGPGAVVTFGVRGGRDAGQRLIEACELCSHLANVGDAKTLIIHPASTTHRRLDEEGLRRAGVTDDMVRVSVGLETLDDIVWDLDQAIRAATA
jgi:O-acetylhomoserine (thiol)-lyase